MDLFGFSKSILAGLHDALLLKADGLPAAPAAAAAA